MSLGAKRRAGLSTIIRAGLAVGIVLLIIGLLVSGFLQGILSSFSEQATSVITAKFSFLKGFAG